MIIPASSRPRGIALIIVMVVITFFSILVAGFAYSMKVETHLARTSGFDSEMDWLGRSGVELAKYVVGVQLTVPGEQQYTALNQKWAGGPGNSNSILADVQLENNAVGHGTFSVKITDCERKINVNAASEMILGFVMAGIGVDASESPPMVSSILDWIDVDDSLHMGGAEKDYYLSLVPPYRCKDGLMDDINELRLVKGITPELFFGPSYVGTPSITRNRGFTGLHEAEPVTYSVGLSEVLTCFGGPTVNINTASASVIRMFPGLNEEAIVARILERRAGLDGVDGTEDDVPFRNPGELMAIVGQLGPGALPPGAPVAPVGPVGGVPPGQSPPPMASPITSFFGTQSFTFEVEVQVTLNDRRRTYYALLRRQDPKNVQILNIWWK